MFIVEIIFSIVLAFLAISSFLIAESEKDTRCEDCE